MSNFQEYPIYKKRDGQSFEQVSYIFADSFEDAKKEFAENMTKDNHNKSNNIVWLDEKQDGVPQTGWYDLDSSICVANEEDGIDYANSKLELFCSEESIKEGFDSWTEDVYTWELRESIIEEEEEEEEEEI